MIQLTSFALVSILFAIICGSVLVYVGMTNIRSGTQALAQTRSAGQQGVWHKQTSILFGLNNIVFALLIVLVVLLGVVTDRSMKYVLIALIVVALLTSIVLVVRCIAAALQSVKSLRNP
jgi:threonine/homoserine/homoserine lactone efflux protein